VPIADQDWRMFDFSACLILVQVIFIARQHTDARYWYSKFVRSSVCPSVRPSVTFGYQI